MQANTPTTIQSLGSDNHSGVLDEVMQSMARANVGHAPAYGADADTGRAEAVFKEHFGEDTDVHFVFNGTAANVLSLQALIPSYGSVLCSGDAHLSMDECAAPERQLGCKIQTVAAVHGKLTPELLEPHLIRFGDQHYAAPRAVSLTQSTEVGTVYTPDEIRSIVALARTHGLLVHMDGARLVNAAAALDVSLAALTRDVGIDVLSFGGTKHGLMGGEAVVFFGGCRARARDFKFIRKQSMQLGSKLRFVAAQFETFLQNDLWRRGARHALSMAQRLAAGLADIPHVQITQPVQANAVFARIPKAWVKPLREQAFFYVWREKECEVRLMTSFDTTAAAIDDFTAAARRLAPP